jgi:hypothetical protein
MSVRQLKTRWGGKRVGDPEATSLQTSRQGWSETISERYSVEQCLVDARALYVSPVGFPRVRSVVEPVGLPEISAAGWPRRSLQ